MNTCTEPISLNDCLLNDLKNLVNGNWNQIMPNLLLTYVCSGEPPIEISSLEYIAMKDVAAKEMQNIKQSIIPQIQFAEKVLINKEQINFLHKFIARNMNFNENLLIPVMWFTKKATEIKIAEQVLSLFKHELETLSEQITTTESAMWIEAKMRLNCLIEIVCILRNQFPLTTV